MNTLHLLTCLLNALRTLGTRLMFREVFKSRKNMASFLALSLAFVLLANPDRAAAGEVLLEEGRKVRVVTTDYLALMRDELKDGQDVEATIWRDVMAEGEVVIRKGTPVKAMLHIHEPNKEGDRPPMTVTAEESETVDGQVVKLEGILKLDGAIARALASHTAAVLFPPIYSVPGIRSGGSVGTLFDARVTTALEVVPD